jgi:ABC-type Fe3+ transport system permease subunit
MIALAVLLMAGTLALALLAEWVRRRGVRRTASLSRHGDD